MTKDNHEEDDDEEECLKMWLKAGFQKEEVMRSELERSDDKASSLAGFHMM